MLAPLVAARAAAEFAGDASHANLCPGEAVCERFQTAAGADPAAKAANACTGCAMLPTKIAAGRIEMDAELAVIERVRRERDSGAGCELTAISAATWELVQWWDQLAARLDRRQRYETHELLTALLSAGTLN